MEQRTYAIEKEIMKAVAGSFKRSKVDKLLARLKMSKEKTQTAKTEMRQMVSL